MYERLLIGLQGKTLSSEERQWLADRPPLGVILFARNIESPAQVAALLAEAREAAGRDLWAAVDEEGGRVNRIPWPPFSGRRHAAQYGEDFATDPDGAYKAVYADNLRVGEALKALGFTHNCAPDLDVFNAAGHAIIGERSYGADIDVVTRLGEACLAGLRDAGIEGVGKHFPGHGRADADSHLAVPKADAPLNTLLAEAEPFRQLVQKGMRHIMTAHVIYPQVENCVATLSDYWLKSVLGVQFGFEGHIWSDDLCMKGVGDDLFDAAEKALAAGCNVLLVCEPEGVQQIYSA